MNAICARAQGTGSTTIGVSALSVAVTITDPSARDVDNSAGSRTADLTPLALPTCQPSGLIPSG